MSKGGTASPSAPAFGDGPFSPTPSHAGAVVWRDAADGPLFLLLTARHAPAEWVLPKGHIEKDESPARAARREVREEAGIDVHVGAYLGTENFAAKGEEVVCAYYLACCPRERAPEKTEKKRPSRAISGDSRAGTGSYQSESGGSAGSEADGRAYAVALPAAEERMMVWLSLTDSIQRSTFPAGRRMLAEAGRRLGVSPA